MLTNYFFVQGWGSNATFLALFSGIVIHHPARCAWTQDISAWTADCARVRAHPGFLVRSTR